MSDTPESLQDLVRRRLAEMDRSLRSAYEALAPEEREVTYEVLRRVQNAGHTRIGDKAVRTIAAMLGASDSEVATAAGLRPARAPFVLPERANTLSDKERALVLGFVDALLEACHLAPDEVIVREALSRPSVMDAVRAHEADAG